MTRLRPLRSRNATIAHSLLTSVQDAEFNLGGIHAPSDPLPVLGAVEHPQVAQALKAIREHCRNPMTAEGFISGVPMSRRRLHDAIVRYIGRSVTDEITRLRVEHAKRLLAETSEKQHQVAVKSGFRNDARLVLVFTRVTGMTPGEYRRIFNPSFAGMPKLGRPPGGTSSG